MKKIVCILTVLTLFNRYVLSQSIPTGSPTTTSSLNQLGHYGWHRGGNYASGPAGNNNIFGTYFNSDIFVFTNGTKLAAFTTGNYLTSLNGNAGNGLRIFNPLPNNTGGNLDLFTSANSGQNETHIVFGVSGQISGQSSRFEQYGNLQGFYFDVTNPAIGRFDFARSGTVTGTIGTNNFWRIGEQADTSNIDGNRRLEVVDNTWQLRLSNDQTHTDFMSNSSGNLQIKPYAGKVGINATSNPSAVLDVFGDLRIRNVAAGQGSSLLIGASNGNSSDVNVRRIDFTGNNSDVLRGDGTFGPTQSLTANNGITLLNNQLQFGEPYNLVQTVPLQNNREIALNSKNVVFSGQGAVGIGLNNPQMPTEKLDINGNIRLRTLPDASNQDNTSTKVVVVNSNGVLKWKNLNLTQGAENGCWVNTNNQTEWGSNPLMHDTEIPTNGYNIFFSSTNVLPGVGNIKVGGNTNPVAAKFSIVNQNEDIGAWVSSISSVLNPTNRIGLLSESENATVVQGIKAKAMNGEMVTGIIGTAYNGQQNTTGINGYAQTSTGTGNVFGGVFRANSNTIDLNCGVSGSAAAGIKTNIGGYFKAEQGTTSIGVYGEATSNAPGASVYAGYFTGPVISGNNSIPSDQQFKTNVTAVQDAQSILESLNPVTYSYLQTGNAQYMHFPEGTHYGFIAQEVEQVIPELVSNVAHPDQMDSSGNISYASFNYKTVNYQGLVPVLVKGHREQQDLINSLVTENLSLQNTQQNLQGLVNELNARLTELENCLNSMLPGFCSNSQALQQNGTSLNPTESSTHARLDQNIPNPYVDKTRISFFIPNHVQHAQIQFYSTEGKRLFTEELMERGEASFELGNEQLKNGVYSYSLFTDGKFIQARTLIKY
jgi:hypothetical protein